MPTAHPYDPSTSLASGEERFVARRSASVSVETVRRRSRAGLELDEFGPLLPFVSDAAVTDVFVNGPDRIWVDRGLGAVRQELDLFDEGRLRDLAVRLGLDDLAVAGFFSMVDLETVSDLVARRRNLLITGAGGSGKTTLLAALLSSAAPGDRIIAIEDVGELRVAHPHFVSLEARQANLEGAGYLGLERLVREALRMRPDRLVLGECRGAEIRELLAALNTGHDGGAGTLHANSLEDVPARIEALGALAGMSPTAIARQTVSAIGTVLHLERDRGTRRLSQIGRFELDHRDRLRMVESTVERMVDSGATP